MTEDVKLWRVYFNRREDWPFLVAVDNGTIKSQIRVQWFNTHGVDCVGRTDVGMPGATIISQGVQGEFCVSDRKGKPNEPTWWIEMFAQAEFVQGGVIFHGAKPIDIETE